MADAVSIPTVNPITSVALGVKPPAGISLTDMMNMATGAQAYQQAKQLNPIQIQNAQEVLRQNEATANVAQQTQQPKIEQELSLAETARINALKANYGLNKEQTNDFNQIATGFKNDPRLKPDYLKENPTAGIDVINEAMDLAEAKGIDKKKLAVITHQAMGIAINNPNQLLNYLTNVTQAGMTSAEQQGMQNKTLVQTGGAQTPMSQAEINAMPAGSNIQNTLPATTQRYNPVTKQMEFIGQPANAKPLDTNVPAQAPLGTAEQVQGQVQGVVEDYKQTRTDASTAQSDIALLQNIKKYSQGAVTGAGADRRAYISGWASLFGIDDQTIQKTDTDLLAKNAARLAASGGDTDSARLLESLANPNNKMTKQAIDEASNQLIAIRKLRLLKNAIFTPLQNDAQKYSDTLVKWNNIADPRVLQYMDMNVKEKESYLKAMPKSQQNSFLSKLGIIKGLDDRYQLGLTK